MTDYIEERRYDKANKFLEALTPWATSLQKDEFVFRGHSNSSYLLLPTSLRIETKDSIWDYSKAFARIAGSTTDNEFSLAFAEYQLIRDFYKIANSRGLQVPSSDRVRKLLHQPIDFHTMAQWDDGDMWLPEDLLEVAALAQHYGIPTRLLDWTYDPFVAAFFASKPPCNLEHDLCIWGLNTSLLGHLQTGIENFPLRFVTPHYSDNPNLAAQSGLFTHWAHSVPGLTTIAAGDLKALPCVDRRPLDFQLCAYLNLHTKGELPGLFFKMILPGSEAAELARLLRKFGYGPAKMFPGYGGVAMEIKETPFLRGLKA